jgi:hypothetical protein
MAKENTQKQIYGGSALGFDTTLCDAGVSLPSNELWQTAIPLSSHH